MKNQLYFGIAIRLVILFSLGILFSFVPEHLRVFFGDLNIPDKSGGPIDRDWVWGARHYWFAWMMFFLFILSLINFVMSVYNLIIKYYPEVK